MAGVLGSLGLHAALWAAVQLEVALPSVDFELHAPAPVELGLEEARPAAAPAPVAQGTAAAGIAPSAATPPPAHESGDAAAARTEPAAASAWTAFAPAGANIELRVHLGRIRATPLAGEVSGFLAAIPDWQSILGGAGLDPLRDLERLYLASPDLRRSKLVIAGQYVGDEQVPRRAVAQLAQARGVDARWRMVNGMAVAPWANADATQRVLALIAPHQFVITRPADLGRVLQIARARARLRQRQPAPTASAASGDQDDSLLGLEDGELLALSVEGARRLVGGNIVGVPTQLELAAREQGGLVQVRSTGDFEDEPAAARAQRYWLRQRDRFASHPLVAFSGLRPLFSGARVELAGRRVIVTTSASVPQARLVLGFIRGAISSPPPEVDALPAPPSRRDSR